jgi:predicted PurR-regulated permease PerM
MPEKGSEGKRLEVIIPWATIFKIFAACALGYALIQLRVFLGLFLLALLIGITLYPIVRWTADHRWPKWTGVLLSAVILLVFVGAFFAVLIPAITTQGRTVIKNLPALQEKLLNLLPQSGMARDAVNRILNSASFSNPEPLFKHFMSWGGIALKSVVEVGLMLIMAVYLVVDGPRVFEWLLAYLPHDERKKVHAAGQEMASVVYSYMAGQLITSVVCAVYSFVGLTLMHVPQALLLAVLAGICDILPIIGFFIAVIPAMLLAVTVSPGTALMVLALYVAYHWIENYFIVPKVYGNKLRLSTLTVLVSVVAAGLVAGVIGAIAILPIVASYPIVERIWLKPRLAPGTVARHKEIDEHPPE